MPPPSPRRVAVRAVAVIVGMVWFTVAFLGYFSPRFFLYEAFQDLGLMFWVLYTALGVGLVSTIAWSAMAPATLAPRPGPTSAEVPRALIGANPARPTQAPGTCFRCNRILPPWRSAEGTCTVCSPYSTFLRQPRVANPALERRRTTLFLLEGLGIALLALSFVSAAYLFPLALGPARSLLTMLAFLVFMPLLAGLILWMYARQQRQGSAGEK